jgi:hypothetical protein
MPACLCVASFISTARAEDQVLQVYDSVCMTPLVDQCATTHWPAHAGSIVQGNTVCPSGYSWTFQQGCFLDTTDAAAVAGRYEACRHIVESTPPAQQCVRRIQIDRFLNSQTELNSTLQKDMRTLLNQFCKAYPTAPEQAANCDKVIPPAGSVTGRSRGVGRRAGPSRNKRITSPRDGSCVLLRQARIGTQVVKVIERCMPKVIFHKRINRQVLFEQFFGISIAHDATSATDSDSLIGHQQSVRRAAA